MLFRFVLMGLLLWSFASCVAFAQTDRSEEIAALLKGLNSNGSSQRINTAKLITRAGIVDVELYERVAGMLAENYAKSLDSNHVDEMSWLCKALAASGNPRYKSLLSEIASNSQSSKLQHYATQSLSLIEEYAHRSQILNTMDSWDPELSEAENRLTNMLNSDSIDLKRDAAKMISRSTQVHLKVYATVATQLSLLLEQKDLDSQTIDTLAWFCKTLGASGYSQYAVNLRQVQEKTQSQKLQEYASRAIQELH